MKVRVIVSTHRPQLDRLLVQFAEAATGQQLQRICASFTTSDTEPVRDTWAARDLDVRELKGGMSEIRVLVPTADALADVNTLDRCAEQLWREQHAAANAAAAAADEPDVAGARRHHHRRLSDAAASPATRHRAFDRYGTRFGSRAYSRTRPLLSGGRSEG